MKSIEKERNKSAREEGLHLIVVVEESAVSEELLEVPEAVAGFIEATATKMKKKKQQLERLKPDRTNECVTVRQTKRNLNSFCSSFLHIFKITLQGMTQIL